jgi:hypothetical protein
MKRAAMPAGQALASYARSDLHDAGLELFPFFESMINPEDLPPMRVPDSHAATSAVFKTPFVVDLPFSGNWDPSIGRTILPDEENPTDGYSEVILCPGSTDCYFHTLGTEAVVWNRGVGAHSFGQNMTPILATHPVDTDIVGGRTQLIQGLRSYNATGVNNVAILPKLNSIGHAIFECFIIPENILAGEQLEMLFGFWNNGVKCSSRTPAHITFQWNSGALVTVEQHVATSGDNNTGHSAFYLIQTPVPVNDDFVVSFYVEVEDVDPASHWKFSLAEPLNNSYGITIPARSACAFAVVDAPEMDVLSETLSERTSALTGLLTYMGSTLQDGGQVSAARLGMGLSPLRAPIGDVYRYLASLPYYNDDYALREGIYSWWLPDSIQEHFYVPYRAPRSDNLEFNAVLQFAVHRDNPNQGIRLKVVQNLEVITRSRLYTSVSGANNPAYSSVVGLIKTIPAVTINKKHIGILGRALGGIKSWLSKPANWRKLIRGGAGLISRFLPGSKAAAVATGVSDFIG